MILTRTLDLPGVIDKKFGQVVTSAVFSILSFTSTLIFVGLRSRAVGEEGLVTLMQMMTGNCQWLPYLDLIAKRTLDRNVDLTCIEGPLPFNMSNVTYRFNQL
jgi:hypothetical protein